MQNKDVHEKTIHTNLEKYGCENSASSNIVKEKIQNTFEEKYGVKFLGQAQLIKDKIKNTLKERYGVDHMQQNAEIKQKRKDTMLKKYGTTFVRNDEQYRKNCIEKYGFSNPKIYEAWVNVNSLDDCVPMFTKEEFIGGKQSYKWKCKKCGSEFEAIYADGKIRHGCPYCNTGSSKYENELIEFLKNNNIIFYEHDRTILYPLELDFVISSLKIAIEFNGVYWHSIGMKDFNYHLNKTLMCNEKGYRLIHIWENEWLNNKEEIKRKLISIFENKEVIDFSKPLDRSWFNNISSDEYVLKEETEPELILRKGFNVPNCGYLIY